MSTLNPPKHFLHIDGLRCLAAGLVLIQHTLEETPVLKDAGSSSMAGDFLVNNLNMGRFGVIVFFLISGFLIPSTLKPGPSSLPKFFISRVARLYPLYWVSLISGALVALALALPMLSPTHFALSLTMVQKLAGVKDVYGPYWTLFVEIIFYALCVGLFLFRQLHIPSRIFSVVCLLALLSVFLSVLSIFTVSKGSLHGAILQAGGFINYMMVMFTGYLFRLHQEQRLSGASLGTAAALFVTGFLVYAVCRTFTMNFSELLGPRAIFFSSTLGLLTFWLTLRHKLWQHPLIIHIGLISYGIYLFHAQVIRVGVWLLGGSATTFGQSLALIIFVTLLTVLISHFTYKIIELPCMRLGLYLRRRFFPV